MVSGEGAATGTLVNQSDDYFTFDVPITSWDRILLDLNGTSVGNVELLWDPDGEGPAKARVVASGDAIQDTIDYIATADGGTYYVRVFAPTSDVTNETYTLSVVIVESVDPIVLDLGSPGIAFSQIDDGVQFDMDGDGVVDQVAWTAGGDDGILAFDADGSGTIDNSTEIFSQYFGGGSYTSGLAALATLDSNVNGLIDSADSSFTTLQVWLDNNHDGLSNAGELVSLTDLGIVEINLNASVSDAFIDGQQLLSEGTFSYADGTIGSFVEVAFDTAFENGSSQYLFASGEESLTDDAVELTSFADQVIVATNMKADATKGSVDGQQLGAEGTLNYSDSTTGSFIEVAFDTTLGPTTGLGEGDTLAFSGAEAGLDAVQSGVAPSTTAPAPLAVIQEDSFQFTATEEVVLDVSSADVDVEDPPAAGADADSEASGSLDTEANPIEQASNDNTAAPASDDPFVALG